MNNFKHPPFLKDLAGAWIFYTIFPRLPFVKPTFNRIARFAPIIGLVIGGLQSCFWILGKKLGWPNESLALLSWAIGVLVTGGLHIDGLMDTADGLAAPKSRCLSAMRDSRVGASGVQALIICFSIQIASLISLGNMAPIVFPIANFWGRVSPLWAIANFSYLHAKESDSFHHANWKDWKEIKPSVITWLLSIYFLPLLQPNNSLSQRIFLCIGILPALFVPQYLGKRLGGHSGDTYGSSIVIVETCITFMFAIFLLVK